LDLPSLGVVRKRGRDFSFRDDYHVLAFGQPQPSDMPPLAPDNSRPAERLPVPDATVAEQPAGRDRQPAPVRDAGVSADTDAARDAFAPQVAEPVLADKLAVGVQIFDGRKAEQVPELVEDRDAFGSVRATLLRQDGPQDGEGCAL